MCMSCPRGREVGGGALRVGRGDSREGEGTCYGRDAAHIFQGSSIWELKISPKKRKMKLLPDKNSHDLGTQRELCKRNGLIPTVLV